MVKYNSCLRCGSENVDNLMVNSKININYPEKKTQFSTTQRVIHPTNALVCNECGHIEFFVDWEKE